MCPTTRGALEAVEWLQGLGRRRLAHVTGPESFAVVHERARAFRSVVGASAPVRFGSWSEAWGHEAVGRLWRGGRPPDGVFCGNDQIARGVVDALRGRGVGVPGDVSVVGFDDRELMAAATRPPLTTVDMNLKELGREAGRLVLALADGTPVEPGLRRLPCRACGGCMAFTFMPLVWASDVDILSEDGRTATLDTPEMRAAVDAYCSMVAKGLVPGGSATDNGVNFMTFTSGRIGQQSIGAFGVGTLVDDHPEIDFGVTLIPDIEGGASSLAGGDNIVATAGTPRLAAVQESIEFAYPPEGQRILAQNGSLPTRLDIAEETLEGLDPRLRVAVDAIGVARTPCTLLLNDLINSANGPCATFTNAVIYGDDVDGAFATAQADMQAIIDNAAP